MLEAGAVFLPCCYGYATTIRRAQGASLHMGCIYFDQHRHPAARGYGYVAVSRFRSRGGCHLYGKLRRTDFLPVGEEKEDEVVEREYLSASSDSSDASGIEHAFRGGDNDDDTSEDSMADPHGLANAFQDGIGGLFPDSDGADSDACRDFV